jgi:hypothetical protein
MAARGSRAAWRARGRGAGGRASALVPGAAAPADAGQSTPRRGVQSHSHAPRRAPWGRRGRAAPPAPACPSTSSKRHPHSIRLTRIVWSRPAAPQSPAGAERPPPPPSKPIRSRLITGAGNEFTGRSCTMIGAADCRVVSRGGRFAHQRLSWWMARCAPPPGSLRASRGRAGPARRRQDQPSTLVRRHPHGVALATLPALSPTLGPEPAAPLRACPAGAASPHGAPARCRPAAASKASKRPLGPAERELDCPPHQATCPLSPCKPHQRGACPIPARPAHAAAWLAPRSPACAHRRKALHAGDTHTCARGAPLRP